MSEKINQLAKQANLWDMLVKYSCEFGNANPVQDCGIELEKFAKLIVKECINELETSKEADRYTGELFVSEKNTILDEQITWLKEHFDIA